MSGGAGPRVDAKSVTVSEGVTLAQACTPSGPELCFNAADDNCNGLIDEGCGVGTGVLQIIAAWEGAADVDLSMTDPRGVRVHEGNRGAKSNLVLERACPEDNCYGQNVENIYFGGEGDPVPGRYVAEVVLADPRGADLPVRVTLSARIGPKTYAMSLALSPGASTERRSFAFVL